MFVCLINPFLLLEAVVAQKTWLHGEAFFFSLPAFGGNSLFPFLRMIGEKSVERIRSWPGSWCRPESWPWSAQVRLTWEEAVCLATNFSVVSVRGAVWRLGAAAVSSRSSFRVKALCGRQCVTSLLVFAADLCWNMITFLQLVLISVFPCSPPAWHLARVDYRSTQLESMLASRTGGTSLLLFMGFISLSWVYFGKNAFFWAGSGGQHQRLQRFPKLR